MTVKQRSVLVVGAGTVGSATGDALQRRGHEVVYIDADIDVVRRLRSRGNQAYLPSSEAIPETDIGIICVPTPPGFNGEMDDRFLRQSATFIARYLRELQHYYVVCVRSTVVPGTTVHVVGSIIEAESGKVFGKDIGLCMAPEYLREQRAIDDAEHPRAIVVGCEDARVRDFMIDLFSSFGAPIHTVSITGAEMQKYMHNAFNACKIAFFNEMRLMCRKLSIADAQQLIQITAETAEACWNPVYGIRDLGPFSGDCLPKDLSALIALASQYDIDVQLLTGIKYQNEAYRGFRSVWG